MPPTLIPRSRLARRLVRLGLPIAIQTGTAIVLNLVDRVMVGQLGEAAINGVTIAGQIVGICFGIAAAVTAGVGVLAAQLVGARDRLGFLTVSINGLYSVIVAGVAATAAVLLFTDPVAAFMTPGDRATQATTATYLTIVMSAFTLSLCGFLATALMQAEGDTRTPMIVSLGVVALNTAANWVLIFGAGPVPAMGVEGAAWATLGAQSLGALALVAIVARRLAREHDAMPPGVFRPSMDSLRRVIGIGLPITLDGIVWRGATLAYAAILARVGTLALAAYTIAATARGLMFLPLVGVAQGAAIAVGQDLGGGRLRRAQFATASALRLGLTLNALFALAVAVFADPIARSFRVEPETHAWAVFALQAIAALQIIETVNTILPMVLRGGGDARRVFLISTTSFWAVGIPAAIVLGLWMGWGLVGVLVAHAAEFLLKAALLVGRFLGGKWRKKLV